MNRIFSFALFLLMSLSVMAQPVVIAHRGSSFAAPENTVAAAKLAWEQGADAVELDIYPSADNRVMVMHDGNTRRTTGQSFEIQKTNSEVLRTLDAGSWKDARYKGEKIPFLEEMIATVPADKKMVIEIKCGMEVLPVLQKIVDSCGKKQQSIFIAFDWQTILEAKKLFPANKCYWLSSSSADVYAKMEEAAKNKLDGLNLNSKIVDQEMVAEAKSAGLEMLSWTIDDVTKAKRLVQLGVSAITTNRPDLMLENLR